MSSNNISDEFYTIKNVVEYSNRMHINTLLEIVINGLAVFIILKHSTAAMGIYKYYILSTVISAFLMDFNISFFFAPFPVFPSAILCSAGIITRNFNWVLGELLPYILMHVTLGFVGFSMFAGYLYQYFSLTNRLEILQSYKCTILLLTMSFIYPLPCILLLISTIDRQGFLKDVDDKIPDLHEFLINDLPCNGLKLDTKTYFYAISILIEIFVACIFSWYLGYKILKKLAELKNVLSSATLKAKKQYLLSLSLQMIIPILVIIIPIFAMVICVVLNLPKLKYMAPYFMQILALHSCFNALLVLLVITPYRKALFKMVPFNTRKSSVTIMTTSTVNAVSNKHVSQRRTTIY